jgi:hypothetical protein
MRIVAVHAFSELQGSVDVRLIHPEGVSRMAAQTKIVSLRGKQKCRGISVGEVAGFTLPLLNHGMDIFGAQQQVREFSVTGRASRARNYFFWRSSRTGWI